MTALLEPTERGQPTSSEVGDEMKRIRALFEPHTGDAEDLITYAKEIVRLRSSAPQEPDDDALTSRPTKDEREACIKVILQLLPEILRGLQSPETDYSGIDDGV